jgi:hypothetical protein
VTVIDCDPALAVNGRQKPAYSRDWMHLNAEGYRAVNALVRPVLEAVTKGGGRGQRPDPRGGGAVFAHVALARSQPCWSESLRLRGAPALRGWERDWGNRIAGDGTCRESLEVPEPKRGRPPKAPAELPAEPVPKRPRGRPRQEK